MLTSEAIALIQRRLGYRTDKVDEILSELQAAQERLENGVIVVHPDGRQFIFRPWFLIDSTSYKTFDTVASTEDYALETGFLAEVEEDALWRFDAAASEPEDEWIPLQKDDPDFLRVGHPGEGEPVAYALVGLRWHLFPVPDDVYTMRYLIKGRDTPPAVSPSDITNNWLTYAPLLLTSEAGVEMAGGSLRDKGAADYFLRRRAAEALSLWNQHEERDMLNRKVVMGGED